MAAITTNLRLSGMAGNVRLAKGEAGLSRACVVNISQLATIDRTQLTERIGALSASKRAGVIEALALILGPDLAAH